MSFKFKVPYRSKPPPEARVNTAHPNFPDIWVPCNEGNGPPAAWLNGQRRVHDSEVSTPQHTWGRFEGRLMYHPNVDSGLVWDNAPSAGTGEIFVVGEAAIRANDSFAYLASGGTTDYYPGYLACRTNLGDYYCFYGAAEYSNTDDTTIGRVHQIVTRRLTTSPHRKATGYRNHRQVGTPDTPGNNTTNYNQGKLNLFVRDNADTSLSGGGDLALGWLAIWFNRGWDDTSIERYALEPENIWEWYDRPLPIWIQTGTGTAYTLTADAGSYTVTGTDVTLAADRKLSAATDAYAVTGTAVDLSAGRKLVVDTGSYAVTGTVAGLAVGYKLTVDAGSYTLTGSDVTLTYSQGYTITADAGSYVITGTDAALKASRVITAAPGTYTLTGSDATLTYSQGYTLTADSGSYTVTGADAALIVDYVVAAGTGSYTLTGSDATLIYTPVGGYTIVSDAGSYALTGTDVGLRVSRKMSANVGSYDILGTDVNLARGLNVAAGSGAIVVSGTDATLSRTFGIATDVGSYSLTGSNVSLLYSEAPPPAASRLFKTQSRPIFKSGSSTTFKT